MMSADRVGEDSRYGSFPATDLSLGFSCRVFRVSAASWAAPSSPWCTAPPSGVTDASLSTGNSADDEESNGGGRGRG